MATLSLWIGSAGYQVTAEGCTTLLEAITKAEEGEAVSYHIRTRPTNKQKSYRRGFLRVDGVTVAKRLWPKFRTSCESVIDGTDAKFQIGYRFISSTPLTRPSQTDLQTTRPSPLG